MSSTTLRDFVLNAVEMNRIRFADLRRLQRDILPYRITRREEVEMLLSLDATVARLLMCSSFARLRRASSATVSRKRQRTSPVRARIAGMTKRV